MNAGSGETRSYRKKHGATRSWRFAIVLFVSSVLVIALIASIHPIPAVRGESVFYDIHGEVIASTAAPSRIQVPLSDISPYLRHAFIAVEDSRFYRHPGIDPIGITRALIRNVHAGRIVEGGSTITQQLAKNMYLPATRTVGRKLAEAVLALYLEVRFSKDEILERYLNLVYLGHGAHGVEAGARLYFGKQASDLSLAEASMLAGITRAPFYYSPYRDMNAAIRRRQTVLDRMVDTNYISQSEADEASKEAVHVVGLGRRETRAAPYFMDYVTDEALKLLGDEGMLLYSGNLKIHTSLDMNFQKAAERAFAKGLDALTPSTETEGPDSEAKRPIQPQGALVALDPRSGHVKALIGGRSYSETQFNRAMQALRQPGSSFKPFFYAAALENGFTAASVLPCEPVTFYRQRLPYTPTDYGEFEYHFRWLTLREALVTSCNVVSVSLANILGPEKGIEMARLLGISSPLGPNLSLVLGTSEVTPFEMALAFAPFANGGKRVQPIFINSIEDRWGRELYKAPTTTRQVLDPRTAFIITDILRQVVTQWGTAGAISSRLTRPVAAKTGSTQNYRDAWFIGYTPDLVCSVYIGNDDPGIPLGKSGATAAGPIFTDFIEDALRDMPALSFQTPRGIVRAEICHETGCLASPACPNTRWELFKSGTQPTYQCPWHSELPVYGR
ncbi:MAG: PBP1A family penicillin-binding protein [Firmicutes bacterium]|nr:PBP1A family penicillin-binding protein [Bacillota bacterium]